MDTRKDTPIIAFGKDLADIIYQDDSYQDKFHHVAPTINMYDPICYILVKEYNKLPQRAIV